MTQSPNEANPAKPGFFKSIRLGREFYVFLVCLAISGFAWLLISLSQEYTTTIQFKATYLNKPADKVLLTNLPQQVDLRISGNGYTLLSQILGADEKEVEIDLSQYRSYGGKNPNSGFIATRSLVLKVARQFSSQLKVIDINPDTLYLVFSDLSERILPVKLRHNLGFKKQFQIDGEPTIQPEAVRVSGPAGYIDSMKVLPTIVFEKEEIEETFTMTLGFDEAFRNSRFTIEPSEVLVTVPVDEFTEGEVTIPFQLTNIPEGYTVKTFPDSVKVKYQVGLSKYNRVRAGDFRAVGELPPLSELEISSKLKIELKDYPEMINVVSIQPERVEFFVRK